MNKLDAMVHERVGTPEAGCRVCRAGPRETYGTNRGSSTRSIHFTNLPTGDHR